MGIRGTKMETIEILDKIKKFTSSIQLNLSDAKTKITSLNNDSILFLGTNIARAQYARFSRLGSMRRMKRNKLGLRFEAPLNRIRKKLEQASFMSAGKSAPKFL